jgi:CHAD domain-containing protein
MNKAQIRKVIMLCFRRLRKYYSLVGKNSGMEDIHHFRVEIKQLRAFLRMLSSKDGVIKIPGPLKNIYRLAGTVRDLQLHKQDIEKEMDITADFIVKYLQQLDKKLDEAKRKLKHAIKPGLLTLARQKIEKRLPGELAVTTIENFIKEKLGSANKIAATNNKDKELHVIRKNLKDVIYVARIFETDLMIPFPYSGWNKNMKKYITGLASTLGKFQDSFTWLSQLKHPGNHITGKGKKWLDTTRRKHLLKIKRLKHSLKNKYGKHHDPFSASNRMRADYAPPVT